MRFALLATLLLAGCGRADLQVVLESLPNEDPFSAVAELSVVVRKGESVVEELRQPFDGSPLILGPMPRKGALHLTVVGYDAPGVVVGRGEARPSLPAADKKCCAVVCFCSVSVFDAGGCSCGDDHCGGC